LIYLPNTLHPSPLSTIFISTSPPSLLYTLSLHDALPIFMISIFNNAIASKKTNRKITLSEKKLTKYFPPDYSQEQMEKVIETLLDRKSTRLNSSHVSISYAVFCLKKKKSSINQKHNDTTQ